MHWRSSADIMIKDFKQYAGITPQGYERLITGTKIPELEL